MVRVDCRKRVHGLAHVAFGSHAVDRQLPTLGRERLGDAEADAAAAAGDEGRFGCWHCTPSLYIVARGRKNA